MAESDPTNFVSEKTTVWDFPIRGDWATHKGDYRGNFAPQIPRNVLLTYSSEGELVLDPMVGSGTTLIEFTATLDGKICPLKGYADWDAISMKKIDTYTTEFTQYRDGKASLSGKRVVSKDGKTMTVNATGTAANGEKVETVAVFDKVDRGPSR